MVGWIEFGAEEAASHIECDFTGGPRPSERIVN